MSFVAIFVWEDHGVPQMHGIRLQSRNMENTLNLGFDVLMNIFAEVDENLFKFGVVLIDGRSHKE